MPRIIIFLGVILMLSALVPLAVIYRARYNRSAEPRISIMWDMDNQGRYKPQQENPFFKDHRASRLPEAGTVARLPAGTPYYDDAAYHLGLIDESAGAVDGNFVTRIPASALPGGQMTQAVLDRGRQRYDIYCGLCHGAAGGGNGMIHQRALELSMAGALSGKSDMAWTPPANLFGDAVLAQPVGKLFDTISHGKATEDPATKVKKFTMPAYAAQIPTLDRWAIVAWIQVLQKAGHVPLAQITDSRELTALDGMKALLAGKAKAAADAQAEISKLAIQRYEDLKKAEKAAEEKNKQGPK